MPVHNGGQYLSYAVNSILQQSDVLLELVIVDDHSTDNAVRALPSDPRIVVTVSPARGIVNALNHGLEKAKYPFIARMDCDDIAEPQRLTVQLDYMLSNPQVDICGSCVQVFRDGDQNTQQGYQLYQHWINSLCDHQSIEREFFVESAIPHPTAMYRQSVITRLGGYADRSWPEDYDLWCRALLAGMKFGKPEDQLLLRWRDHPQRLSRSDRRYAKQQFLQCKAHYLSRYLQRHSYKDTTIWGAGKTGLKLHDYLMTEGLTVNGFIDINPKLVDRLKRNKPVQVVDLAKAALPKPVSTTMVLVAVSARGARQLIRQFLLACGWREQQHFLVTA